MDDGLATPALSSQTDNTRRDGLAWFRLASEQPKRQFLLTPRWRQADWTA